MRRGGEARKVFIQIYIMQVFFQEGRQTLEKFFYFQLCDIVHVSSTGAFFFLQEIL